jgi:phenylpropionate dioxygenase-like ring-hydroxylating dioxygenase large terminal subunit
MSIHASTVTAARSPGPTYNDILATDTHVVPEHFFEESPGDFGTGQIPVSRYTSRDYYELEKKHLWRNIWQMACREEHIPEVGDTYLYEICDMSILVVRSTPEKIKAFWNVCRHRGRQLRSESGPTDVLRCPFHGFAWNLDGSLAFVPTAWDFPQIEPDVFGLAEVRADVWGGFVFINPDLDAEPLHQYLGELVDQFAQWRFEDRFVEAHVAKVYEANWKVVQEAFMESLHVAATHPQQMVRLGDINSRHDCYEHFNRSLHPSGVPSPSLTWEPTQQEMLESMLDVREDEESPIQLPNDMTLREFAAKIGRDSLRPALGDDADDLCDAELIDAMEYAVFPNFHPWASYQRVVYRFRPYGDDHDRSVMEVMMLSPFVGERPTPAECQWVQADESWTQPGVLGITGRILDQDSYNIPRVQAGLRASPIDGLTVSVYQESRMRHLHSLLDRYIGPHDNASSPEH